MPSLRLEMFHTLLGYLVAVLSILSASIAHPGELDGSATPELLTGDRNGVLVLRGNVDSSYKPRYHRALVHAPRTSEAEHQEIVDEKNDLPKWTIGGSHDSKSFLSTSELSPSFATHSSLSKRQLPTYGELGRKFLRIGVVHVSTLLYIRYPEMKPEIHNVTEPWVAPPRKLYQMIRYKATHDWSISPKGGIYSSTSAR